MLRKKNFLLATVYLLATIQFSWCYFWLTRPYVNTRLYELGRERMPFQGRILMAFPLRLAHQSAVMHRIAQVFAVSHFWFPRPVAPEVAIQAIINVFCLLVAGYCTTKIYQGSSKTRLLTIFVYPLFLVACCSTYLMHTVQNFRFVYDLPSLAFFSVAMYLIYFHKHWAWFAILFAVATINRETTLLLLPLYMLNRAVENGVFEWSRFFSKRTLLLVVPLAIYWAAWHIYIRHLFAHNHSEFYPRLDWNVKSMLIPQAWPQMLSACAYLPILILTMRRRISDPQIRAWLWLLPAWLFCMFVYGILVETRIFGELIPLVVCATTLICEQIILERMGEGRSGLASELQTDASLCLIEAGAPEEEAA